MRIYRFYLLFILSIISCTKSIQTRQYYLPDTEFKFTKIYKYQSEEDTLKIEYWEKSRINKDEILTTRKNKSGKLIDKIKETLTENGSYIKSYEILYMRDEGTNATKLYLNENSLFKWDINSKSHYSGQFYFNQSYWNVSRHREFIRKDNTAFNGKEYKTLVYKDTYQFSLEKKLDKNKFIPEPKFSNFIQFTYFAKGIGLIRYHRVFEDSKKETMKLVEIQ
jgi:hypothetical protein